MGKLDVEHCSKDAHVLDLKTVCECCNCLGCKTLHPQASLINLEKPELAGDSVIFEFYAILLIEDCVDGCSCCGRKYYDYSVATMVFLKPGEIFRMSKDNALPPKGWLLAFHPDLLFRTALRNHIKNYTFFAYRKTEALHLSQRETATVTCLLQHIEEELHHPIDVHTSTILSRHIELLLDYCTRFYDRQFITRENKNRFLLDRLGQLLDDAMRSGQLAGCGLPASAQYAAKLDLSEAYFNDLLKFETGKTFEEYFSLRRLESAKRMLADGVGSPAEVAHRLGFPCVQHFCLVFKKIVGVSPSHYRLSKN